MDSRSGVLVELTPPGLTITDRAAESHQHNEPNLLSSLTERQQDQLAELLRTLLRALEDGNGAVATPINH